MKPLKPEELDALRMRGYVDPVFFNRFFLPDWFSSPMGWFHRGMQALLLKKADHLLNFGHEDWRDGPYEWTPEELEKIVKYFVWKEKPHDPTSPTHPLFAIERDASGTPCHITITTSNKVLAMVPRGIGKTTTVNGANLYKIVYKECSFLLYVSEASTHAETQLGNVKRALETNDLILTFFGDLKPGKGIGKWAEDIIECTNGVRVVARGRGAQARGLMIDGDRPDEIVFDDLEDKESVSTDPQRKKVVNWYKGDLEPVLPQMGGKRGNITGLGTLLHPEALMMTLASDPEYIFLRFGAIVDGEPIAPHYMTLAQFERKKQSYARIGQLPTFYMEYGSEVRFDDDSRIFHVDKIKYQIMKREDFLGVGLAMDPAISEDRRADFAAMAVTGVTERGRFHVLDVWEKIGVPQGELIEQFFNLHFRWSPTKHGIEAIAYQTALIGVAKNEMFRHAKTWGNKAYFEVLPIRHGKMGKLPRVEGVLQGRYKAGYITHQQHFGQLEAQLMDWPNGKRDVPDAVAMSITLLDPYAALAFEVDGVGELEVDNLAKDQYPPLEEVLGEDWASAP